MWSEMSMTPQLYNAAEPDKCKESQIVDQQHTAAKVSEFKNAISIIKTLKIQQTTLQVVHYIVRIKKTTNFRLIRIRI
jgi:hypothetical protein